MKQTLVILLLSLYLLGTTQLRELLKFPVLIEHFVEHKKNNQDLNLWDFLCLHYSKDSNHDKDFHREMQFPFKSLSLNASDIVFFMNEQQVSELIVRSIPTQKKQSLIYAGFVHTSTYLSAIWQPPRFS